MLAQACFEVERKITTFRFVLIAILTVGIWNINAHAEPVAGGVYFYQLMVDNFVATRKISFWSKEKS